MISKLQSGRAVNQEQEAFTAYLIKVLNPTDQKDFEDKISKLSEDQIHELYNEFKSMENQVAFAKLGTKIDYLRTLKGRCPEGYTEKFQDGGCLCSKMATNEVDSLKHHWNVKNIAKKRFSDKAPKIQENGVPFNEKGKKIMGRSIYNLGPADSTSKGKAKPNKKQKRAFKK